MLTIVDALNSIDPQNVTLALAFLNSNNLKNMRPETIGVLKQWIKNKNKLAWMPNSDRTAFNRLRNKVWSIYGI